MVQPKLAVVILNYNGQKYLEKFLPNVILHSKPYEVIIADNNSTDNSVDFLKEKFPDIRLIILPENGGFSRGYNQALEQVNAEYYILLNSDIEVTPTWIEALLESLEKDKSLVACQPKIRAYHQKTHFEYAGAAGGFLDKFGYPFCRGRIFDTLEKDEGQYDDPKEIFWATGAALVVRAEAYWKVGGLDEDFFAHMEEIDWCWRIQNQGGKIIYVPESIVFHVGGGTLSKNNPFKTYLNFRNNLALLYKNLPAKSLFFVLLIRFYLDNLALLQFLLKGQFKDVQAILKAYFHFWKRVNYWQKKRNIIQKNIKTTPKLFPKSIVWQYFLKKKKYFSDL